MTGLHPVLVPLSLISLTLIPVLLNPVCKILVFCSSWIFFALLLKTTAFPQYLPWLLSFSGPSSRFVPDGSAQLLPSQPSQNIYVFSFGTYLPWPRCFLKTSLSSNKSLRTHNRRKWLDQETIRFGKRLSSLLRKNSSNKQDSLGGFVTKGETGWQLSWLGRSNIWQTRVPPTRTPRPRLP